METFGCIYRNIADVYNLCFVAQTPCGPNSINGRLVYERLPNIQLQGFDEDIVRDTAPPFMVLEKCQDLCLSDRSSNNLVRACASFDFQPGSRIATYNGGPEYEESTCYLTREQAAPEGIGNLMTVPNSIHFTEVCVSCKCCFDDYFSFKSIPSLCMPPRFNVSEFWSFHFLMV